MRALSWTVRILSWFIYVAIAATVLIASPFLFGYHPTIILSGSMEPAYPVGGITYFKETAFEDYSVGDVVTFTLGNGGSLATHRITEINTADRTFITKGDSNDTEDMAALTFDKVQGKAVGFCVPYAGFAISYMQQHWYIIVAAGLVFLLNMFLDTDPKTSKKEEAASGWSDMDLQPTAENNEPEKNAKHVYKAKHKPVKKEKVSAADFFDDF